MHRLRHSILGVFVLSDIIQYLHKHTYLPLPQTCWLKHRAFSSQTSNQRKTTMTSSRKNDRRRLYDLYDDLDECISRRRAYLSPSSDDSLEKDPKGGNQRKEAQGSRDSNQRRGGNYGKGSNYYPNRRRNNRRNNPRGNYYEERAIEAEGEGQRAKGNPANYQRKVYEQGIRCERKSSESTDQVSLSSQSVEDQQEAAVEDQQEAAVKEAVPIIPKEEVLKAVHAEGRVHSTEDPQSQSTSENEAKTPQYPIDLAAWNFIKEQLDWIAHKNKDKCFCSVCLCPANYDLQFCLNCYISSCYYMAVNQSLFVTPDFALYEYQQGELPMGQANGGEAAVQCFERNLEENEKFASSLLE